MISRATVLAMVCMACGGETKIVPGETCAVNIKVTKAVATVLAVASGLRVEVLQAGSSVFSAELDAAGATGGGIIPITDGPVSSKRPQIEPGPTTQLFVQAFDFFKKVVAIGRTADESERHDPDDQDAKD